MEPTSSNAESSIGLRSTSSLILEPLPSSLMKSLCLDEATGEATLLHLPHPHGDHVHVGPFVVSARDASGFANPAVWTALARKGLARQDGPGGVTLSAEGLAYDCGFGDRFLAASDH